MPDVRIPEDMILPPDIQARVCKTRPMPSHDSQKKPHPKAPSPVNDDTDEEDAESESGDDVRDSDGETGSVASDTSDTSLTEWRARTGGLPEDRAASSIDMKWEFSFPPF